MSEKRQCEGCNYWITISPCSNCEAIKKHQKYIASKIRNSWLTKENMIKARNGDLFFS